MDNIFSGLAAQVYNATEEVAALAADAGIPKSTSEPILAAVNKRARIIQKPLIKE